MSLSRKLGARTATEEPNRLSTKSAPGQAAGPPRTVAVTQPADLKNWIGALPYANPGAVLLSLDQEMSRLNKAEVKPAVRFELLELHAGAYVRLTDSLSQGRSSRGVTDLERHRDFAETARRVTLRMADGYKLVVDATAPKKLSLLANPRANGAAMQRTVLFLCYQLNHYYDQYLPTESRVWIELARLYRLAGERDALDRPGSRGDLRREFGKPISHLYKLALLTALADPYHQGLGEVWKMFEVLGECADVARLGPELPSAGPDGVFVIDPDGVERAKLLMFQTGGKVTKGYYLETKSASALLQKMRDTANQGEGNAFPTARAKQLFVSILNRVILSLKEPPRRANERKAIAIPVNLAVGITATQSLIGGPDVGGTAATFTAGPGGPVQVVEAESEAEEDGVDLLKMIDPRSGATVDVGVDFDAGKRDVRSKEGGAKGSDEAGATVAYGTEPWQVFNKSKRGIGIMRHDPPQTPLCAGEIVSFATKKLASTIGVVRWLTVDEAGVHRAGIQIIGKRADSVSLRAAKDKDNPGAARAALALPFLGAEEKVATLATLPGTFSERGVLIVKSLASGDQVRIQMTSLVDATPSCDRFSYRIFHGNP